MDGSDFTEELRKYQKALKEEWDESNPSEDDTPEEIAKKARRLVICIFPQLIERSTLLALGASSESVSMQAVKFLYNIIVPPSTVAPGTVDPITQLYAELAKNDEPEG